MDDRPNTLKSISPCFLGILVDVFGFTLAPPLLISLFTQGDFIDANTLTSIRYAYLSTSIILYPLLMFFGASFMGDLSDIIGRKKVLMMCMIFFTIGFSTMGIGVELKSITLLFSGRALTGIAAASFATAMAAIADLSRPKKKAAYMSMAVFVQALGFVLGPFIAGIFSNSHLVSFFNNAIPFFLASLLALLSFGWYFVSFQECFIKNTSKKMELSRIFFVFAEAAKHPTVRLLIIAFCLHQTAIGFFFQLILLFFQSHYHYSSFWMGMSYAFFGIWLGTGILLIPYIVKRYHIEWIATSSLAALGLFILGASLAKIEWLHWLLLCPIGFLASIAWSAMLTSFSNAVDAESQGWVMGITASIVALAFFFSGFAINLVPYLGIMPIIASGGILLFIATWIVYFYCHQQKIPKKSTVFKDDEQHPLP